MTSGLSAHMHTHSQHLGCRDKTARNSLGLKSASEETGQDMDPDVLWSWPQLVSVVLLTGPAAVWEPGSHPRPTNATFTACQRTGRLPSACCRPTMPPSGYFVSASGLPWAARCVSLVIPAGDRQVLDPGSFEALQITVHTPSCQHLPLISVKPSKAPQPTAMSHVTCHSHRGVMASL